MYPNKHSISQLSLPEGWAWANGGIIFEWSSGKSLPLKAIELGTVPVYGGNGINGYHRKAIVLHPTLVIGRVGAHCGNVHVTKGESWVTDNAIYASTLKVKISLGFMRYVFQQARLNEKATGSGQPFVNQRMLNEVEIPLPPQDEQKRIVDEIDKQFTRLDAAVANLNRVQANLERYKASVLKAACEGRLAPQNPDDEPAEILLERILAERRRKWEDQEWAKLIDKAKKKAAQAKRHAQKRPARISDLEAAEWQELTKEEYGKYLPKNSKWKEKYKEPEPVDAAGLPELPEGWVWATVESIAEVVSGVAKGRNLRGRETIHVPYMRVANVQQGYLELNTIKEIEALPEEIEKYLLNKEDLLLTEGGDWDKLGRSAIWKGQLSVCIHQNHIFRARSLSSELSTHWLMYSTNSEYGRSYFANSSKQTTNLASINLTQLRAFPVPLPPREEQDRIIAKVERRLSLLDSIKNALLANQMRAERLRQSILQQAFSGCLVPQDPNDEPASALLERIHSEYT